MRKTPGHNPLGFERNSWNYRCLQLRHALGWSQSKLARVMGVTRLVIMSLETDRVTRPKVETIRAIKAVEATYADILKEYKKAPVRMDRLLRQQSGRVRLLPVEILRPKDIGEVEEVATNSEPLFFGRGTRKKMQQTGMSLRWRARLARRGESITRALARKAAKERGKLSNNTTE